MTGRGDPRAATDPGNGTGPTEAGAPAGDTPGIGAPSSGPGEPSSGPGAPVFQPGTGGRPLDPVHPVVRRPAVARE
jgi:hypothetical protein